MLAERWWLSEFCCTNESWCCHIWFHGFLGGRTEVGEKTGGEAKAEAAARLPKRRGLLPPMLTGKAFFYYKFEVLITIWHPYANCERWILHAGWEWWRSLGRLLSLVDLRGSAESVLQCTRWLEFIDLFFSCHILKKKLFLLAQRSMPLMVTEWVLWRDFRRILMDTSSCCINRLMWFSASVLMLTGRSNITITGRDPCWNKKSIVLS